MNLIKIEDILNYKFIHSLKFNEIGTFFAFKLSKMNYKNNKYNHNIYIYNLALKKFKKIISLKNNAKFIWLNKNHILVSSKARADSNYKFYKINVENLKKNLLFQIPFKVTNFQVLDQDSLVLTCIYKNIEKLKDSNFYEIVDEIPFLENGGRYNNKFRNRIYIYNNKNKSLEPISSRYCDVVDFKLSKSRKDILFISRDFKNVAPLNSKLTLYNIKYDRFKNIGFKNFRYDFADFIGDKIIFSGTDMKSYGINENNAFYILDNSNKPRQISTSDKSIGSTVGSDSRLGSGINFKVDKNYLYYISTDNYSSNLNRIDMEGNLEKLTENLGSVDFFDVQNGNIFYAGLRKNSLQEIYSISNKITQISKFNSKNLENKFLSNPEYLSLNLAEEKIEGFVLKPSNFDKSKKYPGILSIHGGPKTVFGDIFFHEMQVLAAQGYFVIYCNPRGSDGKGNHFADLRGKYGSLDYEDLMNFLDLALFKYKNIDENKLALMGGSYGGFMTNWIICHSHRFKAAISQRSISNWTSFFGTTDIGYYFTKDQQGDLPWTNPQALMAKSPLAYADKITTPTLFIHSDEDYRCGLGESMQMFTALKYLGIDSRLCILKGENHELSRSGSPKARIKRLEEILNWLNKYL